MLILMEFEMRMVLSSPEVESDLEAESDDV